MALSSSKSEEYETIDLPFSFSLSGGVSMIDSSSPKAWRNKVITVMSTQDYERVWYMHYGASLVSMLFRPELLAAIDIQTAVDEAFVRWLPELSLESVEPEYDQSTGTMTVKILYRLPTGNEDSVKISTSDISPSGEIVKAANYG